MNANLTKSHRLAQSAMFVLLTFLSQTALANDALLKLNGGVFWLSAIVGVLGIATIFSVIWFGREIWFKRCPWFEREIVERTANRSNNVNGL